MRIALRNDSVAFASEGIEFAEIDVAAAGVVGLAGAYLGAAAS